jgi:CBS domain-containing protein
MTLSDAAKLMRERDVGGLIVSDRQGRLCGFITDRDITIRGIALGSNAGALPVGEICSRYLISMAPETSVDEALATMKKESIRRIAVVKDGSPVGIVSLGDLARQRQPSSALASISAACPQR